MKSEQLLCYDKVRVPPGGQERNNHIKTLHFRIYLKFEFFKWRLTTHIIYDRIAPDDPMRAPTMVSRLLLSRKPSAQSAQPE